MTPRILERLGVRPRKPDPTQDGTTFRWIDGRWVEVCDMCGGNCGQCGWSIGRGVPASMDALVANLQPPPPPPPTPFRRGAEMSGMLILWLSFWLLAGVAFFLR